VHKKKQQKKKRRMKKKKRARTHISYHRARAHEAAKVPTKLVLLESESAECGLP
jgi:hypothetical protein